MPQHVRQPANGYLRLAPEVRDALAAGRPVVALESTVIAHGLPRPTNLTVARAMEAAVRAEGAVPATIALLDGQIAIGLSDAELERLATTAEPVAKASRRGLAIALAQKTWPPRPSRVRWRARRWRGFVSSPLVASVGYIVARRRASISRPI